MNLEERVIALEKEVEKVKAAYWMWFCSVRIGVKELFRLIMDYLEIEIENNGNVIVKRQKEKER